MKGLCLFAALFVLAFAHVAKADDLYNNLSATSHGTVPFGSTIGPLADSFSTGASAFNFNSLTVALAGPIQTVVTAVLLSDASNSPGALLEVIGILGQAVPSSTVLDATIGVPGTPVPSYTLAPNTRYWIEVTGGFGGAWSFSLDTGIGVAGEYSASQPNFSVGIDTWFVVPNSVGPFQMEVAGTTVPEPSTIILLGTGLLGLAGMTWRKKLLA